jgi:tetratricopeptide (TPR) repeat protein
MGFLDWLLGRDAAVRPYIRREPRELIDRYDLPRARFAPPTPRTETLLQAFEGATGLHRDRREFAVEAASLREAAEALEKATRDSLGAHLATAEDFDRLFERELPAPDGIPDVPLLYYGLGAAWGEWLRRHRGFEWHLIDPLDPIQAFDDLDAHEWLTLAPPFSHVTKKFMDPEGSSFAGRGSSELERRMGPPPRALIASPADAAEVHRRIVGPRIPAAIAARHEADTAIREAKLAVDEAPGNGLVLFYAAEVALRHRNWELARGWLGRLLERHPHPRHAFQLAGAIIDSEGPEEEAFAALDLAIAWDPDYWRARLARASLLAAVERVDEARAALQALLAEAPEEIRAEAEDLLKEL